MSIPLLLNGHAGDGRARRWLRTLADNPEVDVRAPGSADGMRQELRRLIDARAERVVVAGGDGTIHHAIQELAGSNVELGIVPLGSGNDLARSLELPLTASPALERALRGERSTIDLGHVDGEYFAVVAGLGIDGDVLEHLADRPAWFRGRAIYPLAVMQVLPKFEPPRLEIELDGQRVDGEFVIAVFANAPYYGGGMQIAPPAALDDGVLDVVLLRYTKRWRTLHLMAEAYRGSHLRRDDVEHYRARQVTVRAVNGPRRLNGDGERLTQLHADPTTIGLVSGALHVVR